VTTEGERPYRPSPPPGVPAREPAPVGWPGSPPPRPPVSPSPSAPSNPAASNPAPSSPAPANPAPVRPSVPPAAPDTTTRPVTTSARPAAPRPVTVSGSPSRKAGRRARLTVKRIDPWSTLKFSFVYSLAGLVVLLVAVVALYAIVDAMGVLNSIRSFLHDVEGGKNSSGIAAWLSFNRVVTVAAVVGVINVILFTAFATVTAFIYNVCTDLVGGIEVTLAEKS